MYKEILRAGTVAGLSLMGIAGSAHAGELATSSSDTLQEGEYSLTKSSDATGDYYLGSISIHGVELGLAAIDDSYDDRRVITVGGGIGSPSETEDSFLLPCSIDLEVNGEIAEYFSIHVDHEGLAHVGLIPFGQQAPETFELPLENTLVQAVVSAEVVDVISFDKERLTMVWTNVEDAETIEEPILDGTINRIYDDIDNIVVAANQYCDEKVGQNK